MARRFLTYNVNGRGVLQPHDNVSDENTMTRRFVTYNVEDQKAGLIPVDEKGVLQPHEGASSAGGGFPNGTEWIKIEELGTVSCGPGYGNGMWICTTRNEDSNGDLVHAMYYSYDGVTWLKNEAYEYEFCFDAVKYANGVWVASTTWYNSPGMLYSVDGFDWQFVQDTDNRIDFKVVEHANGLWVAGNAHGAWSSTDGITWTKNGTYYCSELNYANGLWVMSTNMLPYYSTDGITWTKATANVTTMGSQGKATYADGLWVIAGVKGLFYSTDGMTWTRSNISSEAYETCHAHGRWVAVTKNGIYYSTDGITWEQSNITEAGVDVENACGIWVALINNSADKSSSCVYSADGINWEYSSGFSAGKNNTWLSWISNENGIWFILPDNWSNMYYSVTWKK